MPALDADTIRPLGKALAIGAVGGAVMSWAELPLAWMIGSMLATMAASMAGTDVRVPLSLREPMIGLLGVLLGSGFTPDIVEGLVRWLPSLTLLPVYVVAVGALIVAYLRRFAGVDPITAYFAGTPGGLGEMILLGDRMGADVRNIALIHAVRVVLIVLTIPFLVREVFDVAGTSGLAERPDASPLDLALLAAAGAVGFLVARRLHIPAGALIGPMIVGAVAYGSGIVTGDPPGWIGSAAQVVFGASVGCRFNRIPFWRLTQALLIGVGSTLIMLTCSLLFAYGLSLATGLPLLVLFLAYVPGGLPEMSLIGFALGADPAFVATHHIVRVVLVVLLAPLIFGRYRRSVDESA